MTLVRILKDYDWPILRQTPGSQGIWDGIRFTCDPVEQCDYAVILDRVCEDTTVSCPPEHIWAVMQEPPNEFLRPMHRGMMSYHRIYTQDDDLQGPRYIHSQPALPWLVNKDYDQLIGCAVPIKERGISLIMSDLAASEGHRARLCFFEKMRDHIKFDLFGRGFVPIEDKWDALAPYRYSLVIENFRNPYYWSEKLADCLLAWAMPIYYGCTRINEYFPTEAVVSIDIDDPDANEKIRAVISSGLWDHNLDAISHARRLILDRYQLFPFLVGEIRNFERSRDFETAIPRTITISRYSGWLQALPTKLHYRIDRHGVQYVRRVGTSMKTLLTKVRGIFQN